MADKTYRQSEIEARLTGSLVRWWYEDGFIRRRYRTAGWKGTLMVTNAIGHLAEAAWHHPDILVSFNRLEVRLQTHDAGGITDKDFELAARIEDVVQWQPGAAAGALDGTPRDDARFAYINYD